MNATDAIKLFVQKVVVSEKQERYTGFVESKKNRQKFLDTLDHALPIDSSKAIRSLSDIEWRSPAFLYSSDGTFGMEFSGLKDCYDQASPYGGWLILSQTGNVAIFRPEGKIDAELYFRL